MTIDYSIKVTQCEPMPGYKRPKTRKHEGRQRKSWMQAFREWADARSDR